MEDVKRTARRTTAEHIIKKLAIRNMTGHYRHTAAEAASKRPWRPTVTA